MLLFGGTSQDGTVGENLDRAIDRAESVKKALTGYWADRGFPLDEQNIVPVGSGEALSLPYAEPAFLNHLEDNRVDAQLCFYPQGIEAEVGTQAAIPAKVVREAPTAP